METIIFINDNYTFKSVTWRYQFLSKIVRSLIWMCHCANANRFARRH